MLQYVKRVLQYVTKGKKIKIRSLAFTAEHCVQYNRAPEDVGF
jgi:hypothetical protein